MTSRSAHAGTIRTLRHAGFAQPCPTWLDRLGVRAANDPSGPAVRVVVERGPAPSVQRVPNLSCRTTTVVAGSRLEVIA